MDWTAETVKLHIGEAKEGRYAIGGRYLKFPNDAGGYNVIDWQTGK